MFRPAPEFTLFRSVPLRLIGAVLLILAVAVSIMLVLSLEHEKSVVTGLTEGHKIPVELFPALWQSRRDLIAITALLFLVSAAGCAAVITFIHYQNTRRTLEEVKGLARNILQGIPTGVLTVNHDRSITAVNPSLEAILRRPSQELLGHAYESVFERDHVIRVVLDNALLTGRYVDQTDVRYEAAADGGARTIRVSTAELAGDDGRSAGVILLAKDVTLWLTLEQRLRVAEKLASLHTLSAGVAHELRNPLSAVDLNLHLLEEELREAGSLPAQTGQYLAVLNAECRRLTAILDNFMKFASPGSFRPQAVDVGGVIAHVVSLLRREAEERRIRLESAVAGALPAALGDETQIGQVFLNVVVNAFQAMPGGGVCRIAVAAREEGARGWIEIAVQDSGVGIPAGDIPRLFDPFYTTKVNGSGLGLAIAYRIVQDHGGTIEVASTVGGGTTFVVKLPAAARGTEALVQG
jgi:PAS domain S-box-containing protein